MIETKGFCAAMEAADSALKSADIHITGWEKSAADNSCRMFPGRRRRT